MPKYNLKYLYRTLSASSRFCFITRIYRLNKKCSLMQRLWMKSKYVRNDLETKQLDILTHKNCVFSFQYAEDKKKTTHCFVHVYHIEVNAIKEHYNYVIIHCYVKPFCCSANILHTLLHSKNKRWPPPFPFIRSKITLRHLLKQFHCFIIF